jgi:hypothetical protein
MKLKEQYSEVFEKLEFINNKWSKINKTKENRELTELKVHELLVKNWPQLLVEFSLEELKAALITHKKEQEETLEALRKENSWGEYIDETEFIVDMNKKYKLFTVNASGIVKFSSGKGKIIQRLRLLLMKYHRDMNIPRSERLREKALTDALDVYIDDRADYKLSILKDQIQFDPSINANFDELLDAMRVSEYREIHKAAIKHYMWLIKRKLWRRDAKFHLMIIIFCKKQGFGKSGFLDQLHTALNEVYAKISGDRIQDKFSADLFDKYYIANFDEMAQFGKQGIAILKEFVTRNTFVSRRMFSDVNVESKQNTTMCGTTNRPINQFIYDASGMRRWWQINVDEENYTKMDFKKLDQWETTKFLEFWKSIDESDDIGFYNPILPDYKSMLSYQEAFRAIPPIEQFLYAFEYTKEYSKDDGETDRVKEIALWSMWDQWGGWCAGTKNQTYTYQNFKTQLEGLGYEIRETRPTDKDTGSRNRKYLVTVDDADEMTSKVKDNSDTALQEDNIPVPANQFLRD